MNVLLIGSGGREHALAYKIAESHMLGKLFILPGNPGTAQLGSNVSLLLDDYDGIAKFCSNNDITLVVIGPEKPLVDGMSNYLRTNGIKVFGPNAKAANIEGQKSFAKDLMKKYNVPSAAYKIFEMDEYEQAISYLKESEYPLVLKADGLAAGKGVVICQNFFEAQDALTKVFVGKVFGDAGNQVVIEEFMSGEEATVFAITDGENFFCLPPAQDHKRAGDNDTGRNTGGMGAYSPAPVVTQSMMEEIEEKIIKPVLKGLILEDRKFIGCLYCGLMITDSGIKVVEFNCRFGDPETQAVLPVIEGDFLQLLYSAAEGNLDMDAVKYNGGCAVCVVAASKGYPDSYKKGFEISGLDQTDEGILVFHAGTKNISGKIYTDGGRVLGVTSYLPNSDLRTAKLNAYNTLKRINFNGMYYRSDIADKALAKISS
jgi:phosphoribosylamine--glycine ligase